MVSTRRQQRDSNPANTWRMIHASANESFENASDLGYQDGEDIVLSGNSEQSQSFVSQPYSQSFSIGDSQPYSQPYSQPFSIGGSQDDPIDTYLRRAEDDEQFILKTPFQPSIPRSVRHGSREDMDRSPEPQFQMPRLDVDGSALLPPLQMEEVDFAREAFSRRPEPSSAGLRRRVGGHRHNQQPGEQDQHDTSAELSSSEMVLSSTSGSVMGKLMLAVVRFVKSITRLAIFGAMLLTCCYTIWMGLHMVTTTTGADLTSVCTLPAVSWLDLPICSQLNNQVPQSGPGSSVNDAQDPLADVMQENAAACPRLKMRDAAQEIRALRNQVTSSSLLDKEALVLGLDDYLTNAKPIPRSLVTFNVHVRSAMAKLDIQNKYIRKSIQKMDEDLDHRHPPGTVESLLLWLFPPSEIPPERKILDDYITDLDSKLQLLKGLTGQGRALLSSFQEAENSLGSVEQQIVRHRNEAQEQQNDVWAILPSWLGGNSGYWKDIIRQSKLLERVDTQSKYCAGFLKKLVHRLEIMESVLEALKDGAAKPISDPDHDLGMILRRHLSAIQPHIEEVTASQRKVFGEEIKA
ncbi:hypothetical protein QBC35DRAFT_191969 [Podospora australis]|uniref:Uncharacterized protein n=1 Tax=Podospora australis TaxID=1536484 RepID=A0AAN6WWA5_9PEZI|nr:hypothetical protein QBC35DRAFT_191969 [Podospora australis]